MTITICTVLPEIVLPDLVAELSWIVPKGRDTQARSVSDNGHICTH
jgi:hypothetical protein